MKKLLSIKNKTKISTIALILAFTISAFIVAVPPVSARTQTTYPFLGVVPNPVGVNQMVLFHTGIFQQLNSVNMGWRNMSIIIERPDGQTDVIDDIKTDSTGGTGKTYTPTVTGTYYVHTHFPEQEIIAGVNQAPGLSIGDVMLESDSAVVELVVQADPIAYYPDNPLPQDYWTRPIDAQLRSWAAVTGNWLTTTVVPQVVAGNAEAPESAHILWTKPLTLGGIAGMEGVATDGPEWSFSHGDAYEGKWNSRLIIDGILIYCHQTQERPLYYTALDVRTGEELWRKVFLDNRSISFAQNLKWAGYNHHAVYPYLWVTIGSTWYGFDPGTGDLHLTIENVPSGTTLYDENGWIYRVNLGRTGDSYIWSMVDFIEPFGEDNPDAGTWDPGQTWYQTFDAAEEDNDGNLTAMAQRGYITEFTYDTTQTPGGVSGWFSAARAWGWGDKVFGLRYSQTSVQTWAISLQPGHEGEILFSETWEAPAWWAEGGVQIEFNTVSLEDGAAVLWVHDTLQYYCFSTETGEYMWGPAESEYYMNYYGWTELGERPPMIYNGKLYSSGAGGVIYCYDLTDGHVIWTYEATDPYQEYLFANNWWQFFWYITDGKLYSAHMEHSAIEPMPRGAPFLCLDAETGDVIWRADGLFRSTRWGGRGIIGDSVMVSFDTYDNRLYGVGKGPSALTVEMTTDVTTQGNSIMVKGKVTDVSPGTEDIKLRLRFPNGVPAVADESMSQWMLYVYKQFACPTDVKGVDVFVKIQDPNGDFYSTTVTADGSGAFSMAWAPQIVGMYQVTVLFEGSKSYYPSWATTSFVVDATPAAPSYNGPTADEIAANTAQRTIAMLPQYPNVPTAEEIAADAAQRTINMLPPYPQPTTCPEIPAYLTIDLAVIVLVVVGLIIGLYAIIKKQK
jgi:outer membrane protein assembly factor BamB